MDKLLFNRDGIELVMRQDTLHHPMLAGNKYYKLKYNLLAAKQQGHARLLTFGGAFSNHIAAVAAAGKVEGFQTIGIIRGEELANKSLNPTLSQAVAAGMQLEFVSRTVYREQNTPVFLDYLTHSFGNFYLIPEGGTNALAVRGCQEILQSHDECFDYICCPVGTGGTLSGLINASLPNQQVLGFAVVQSAAIAADISAYANKVNWQINSEYAFGGYGNITEELVVFMNAFFKEFQVALDPVYTGKMMFGIMRLIKDGFFGEKARILVIHTGGLQGISGMNELLAKKKLPTISYA